MTFLKEHRNLQTICLINFVASFGQACVIPILPIYVRSFEVSYFVVGLVISGSGIARLFTDIPVGFLLDRHGRKPVLRLTMLLLAISTLFPIFEGGIAGLLFFQLVQGTGMGILAIAGLTFVGDTSPQDKRGSYVGYLFASDFLGVSIGSLAGGELVEIRGFQAPFVAMLVLSAVAALLVETVFYESMPPASQGRRSPVLGLGMVKSGRNLMVALVAAATVSVLISGIGNTAIPLYGASILMSPFEIGLALTTISLVQVIVLPWSGGICDRVGAKRVFVIGFILSAVSSLLFILSKQFYTLAAVAVLLGLSIGIASSAHAAIVIESSSANSRGSSMALYKIFRDLGSVLGPVMVGVCSDLLGICFAFVLSTVVCFATAALGFVIRRIGRT